MASFFNQTQAAEYCGYSKAYFYRLTSEGRIPHYKPQGGKLYFLKEELDQFILRGRKAADYEIAEKAEAFVNGGRL